MSLRKADGPLTVQLPTPAADRPSWWGVGVIAVVGFVAGIAWPRLVGVRLGPAIPESLAPAASAEPAPSATVSAPGSAPPSVAAVMSAPAAGSAGTPSGSKVTVGHGSVYACKTPSGETRKGAECGGVPALDGLVIPRLRRLAECPDAAGASGKLHVNVRADFGRGGVTIDLAREKSLSQGAALVTCVRPAIASLRLTDVAHENARYSVAYTVTFAGGASNAATANTAPAQVEPEPEPAPEPAPAPAAPAATAPAAADGTAQVEWEVALVRDAPKNGKVIARLPRGTPVRVGPGHDGWYPVKYGDGFASDGWVYRGAIGR